jgi:hypothetical protein
MGLLEYQALPSVRDVAHDGVLYTFSDRSALYRGKSWSAMAGGMDRPSRTKSHPAGSLSSSQPGGSPCWAGPLAFGLIGDNSFSPHPSPLLSFLSVKQVLTREHGGGGGGAG